MKSLSYILLLCSFLTLQSFTYGASADFSEAESLIVCPGLVLRLYNGRVISPFYKKAKGGTVTLSELSKAFDLDLLMTFCLPGDVEDDRSLFDACSRLAIASFDVVYPRIGYLFYLKRTDGEKVAKQHFETMEKRGYKMEKSAPK